MSDYKIKFGSLHEAALSAGNIPFRYLYLEIVDGDSSESFGVSLSKTLNDLARIGAEVVNISTSFHIGAPLRVAQIVVKVDALDLGSTFGIFPGDEGADDSQPIPDSYDQS